jgi:Replication-relaxation
VTARGDLGNVRAPDYRERGRRRGISGRPAGGCPGSWGAASAWGKRAEPGPVFVAHAAALTDLYVSLTIAAPAGLVLEEFRRERRARGGLCDPAGRERTIAPDATIRMRDGQGRLLVGFLEVDLGTMVGKAVPSAPGGALRHGARETVRAAQRWRVRRLAARRDAPPMRRRGARRPPSPAGSPARAREGRRTARRR